MQVGLNKVATILRLLILSTIICLTAPAVADEPKYDMEIRMVGLLGNGVPANDILGTGIAGRYRLKDRWFAGAAVETYAYDFERPYVQTGIAQDPTISVIDADATNTVLSGFVGREYGNTTQGFGWFWTAGLGVGLPDVDPVTGPTASGGVFDITTDAGTEFHILTSAGLRYHFNPQWSLGLTARLEHHFMDISLTDQVTGNTGKVDSQSPHGGHLSISYRF